MPVSADAALVRGHNFSAGPAALPTEVLEEVREELLSFSDAKASVMEISHRSPQYTEVHEGAKAAMKRLLGLGDEWHILFLQGGASLQFHQVPLNFLGPGQTADYLDTGTWSAKAIKEARIVAKDRPGATATVASSSADAGYSFIPGHDERTLTEGAAYVHFTSNNTIFGTEYATEPEADAPLVCDASSDFLGRPIDASRYGLIYAGAQKNIGPSGVCAVLVREDFLQTRVDGLPTLLDFGTHAERLFHTPPSFAVYVLSKVMAWLERSGGLESMAERNRLKAATLYGAIDATDFYTGTAREDSRSLMNVTFRLPSEDLEAQFVREAETHDLLALKGYRTVGGVRASLYNAIPQESVDTLVSFMREFERANG
ncbi:MAG: 3-phosphoserine/phosphohydroxythreonine transaminase [Bacteroidota bacterium]